MPDILADFRMHPSDNDRLWLRIAGYWGVVTEVVSYDDLNVDGALGTLSRAIKKEEDFLLNRNQGDRWKR